MLRKIPALVGCALACLAFAGGCAQINKPVPPGGDAKWSGTADLLTQPSAEGGYY